MYLDPFYFLFPFSLSHLPTSPDSFLISTKSSVNIFSEMPETITLLKFYTTCLGLELRSTSLISLWTPSKQLPPTHPHPHYYEPDFHSGWPTASTTLPKEISAPLPSASPALPAPSC